MPGRNFASALLAGSAVTLLAACRTAAPLAGGGEPVATTAPLAHSANVPLPEVMARSCQGCHAVRAYLPSPNRDAPGFAEIANMEGLTPNTLAAFLRDAHNYPEEMKMTLTPKEVDAIVAYVLTLRDPNYRPMP